VVARPTGACRVHGRPGRRSGISVAERSSGRGCRSSGAAAPNLADSRDGCLAPTALLVAFCTPPPPRRPLGPRTGRRPCGRGALAGASVLVATLPSPTLTIASTALGDLRGPLQWYGPRPTLRHRRGRRSLATPRPIDGPYPRLPTPLGPGRRLRTAVRPVWRGVRAAAGWFDRHESTFPTAPRDLSGSLDSSASPSTCRARPLGPSALIDVAAALVVYPYSRILAGATIMR